MINVAYGYCLTNRPEKLPCSAESVMRNNWYRSRYNSEDMRFNRTDKWKHIAWEEEEDTPLWVNVLAVLGFAGILIFLIII